MPKKEPIIDPVVKGRLRPLSADESARLEAGLLAEGCRDALVVWEGPNILLDGHHRLEICQRHDIPYEVITLPFESREDALAWVDDNQDGRRNLTTAEISYRRGQEYNRAKKAPHRPKKKKGAQTAHLSGEEENPGKTAEKIAEAHGVDPATIRRDGQFAEALDAAPKETRKAVLNGELPKSAVLPESPPEPPPALDKNGQPWTDKSLPALECLDDYEGLIRQFSTLSAAVTAMSKRPIALHLDCASIATQLQRCAKAMRQARPYAVCPECDGSALAKDGSECQWCRGGGWVKQDTYTRHPKANGVG